MSDGLPRHRTGMVSRSRRGREGGVLAPRANVPRRVEADDTNLSFSLAALRLPPEYHNSGIPAKSSTVRTRSSGSARRRGEGGCPLRSAATRRRSEPWRSERTHQARAHGGQQRRPGFEVAHRAGSRPTRRVELGVRDDEPNGRGDRAARSPPRTDPRRAVAPGVRHATAMRREVVASTAAQLGGSSREQPSRADDRDARPGAATRERLRAARLAAADPRVDRERRPTRARRTIGRRFAPPPASHSLAGTRRRERSWSRRGAASPSEQAASRRAPRGGEAAARAALAFARSRRAEVRGGCGTARGARRAVRRRRRAPPLRAAGPGGARRAAGAGGRDLPRGSPGAGEG